MNERRNRGRIWARVAFYLLLIYVFLRWFEYKMTYAPSARMDGSPQQLHRPYEDVFIPIDGKQRINAWYFPASHSNSGPVFIVSHGNAGNISHRLDLAKLLTEAGGGVLLYDYRGYGRSDGRPGEENTYRDAQAAFQWLAAKGIAPANIISYGESLGGGVASELAVRERVGGLILQSTFTSLPDLGRELFPWLPVRLVSSIHYNTRAKLPGIHVPVLIMHSPEDDLIPFHHAQENFSAANQPKFFTKISGGHNGAVFMSKDVMLAAIRDFLKSLSNPISNVVKPTQSN